MHKDKEKQKQTGRNNWGLDASGMDKSVDPAKDFFKYANGQWIKDMEIPEDQTAWGSFYLLAHQNISRLKGILEALVQKKEITHDSEEQKLRDLYFMAMDMDRRNRDRLRHLQEKFESIANLTTEDGPATTLAQLQLIGAEPLFSSYVDSDPHESRKMALFFLQGGLGLPDREYYLAEDKEDIRQKYIEHIQRLFLLLGDSIRSASQTADSIIKIETELAKASWESWKLRDVEAQCNYFSPEELHTLCPSINWRDYFTTLGIDFPEFVIVGQPDFFERVSSLVSHIAIEDWRAYLRWKLISLAAPYLGEDFVEENFNFFGRVLNGQKKMKPLWERSVREISGLLGEMLGKLYVKRYFPPEAKVKIQELVSYIIETCKIRLKKLEWMSEATKNKALEKLEAIIWKLGYPDLWRDYSPLYISKDAYILNVLRAIEYETKRRLTTIGKEIEKREWRHMSPQTVNACADPGQVEMMFPAGILQWPFFDNGSDDAINFGGIGSVIGHELIHHFDDQGSKFDFTGNLKSWWTKEDRASFEERGLALVRQFDQYEILGKKVNGKLTLGENIADLGGLSLAFEAYQKFLKDKGNRLELDGFTPEQRFFLGLAQAERYKMRDELQLQILIADPHSPPKFRINGPLSNMLEFYKAFGVEENKNLYRQPEDRITIW